MAKSAQQIVQNWQGAMQNPMTAQRYRDSINAVNVNPMELAASPEAQQRYAANTAAAVASGKMAKKLQAVTPAAWKAAAVGPGATNLVTGAQKGLPKMQAASQQIAAAGAQAQQAAKGAQGVMGKIAAAINATRQAWGYNPVA